MRVASWQSDPLHRHELRWWDGERWTGHVSDAGVNGDDPVQMDGTTPAPAVTSPVVALQPHRHWSHRTEMSTTRRRAMLAALAVLVVGVAGVIVYSSNRGDDAGVTVMRSRATDRTDVSPVTTLPPTVLATTETLTTAAPTSAATTTTTVVPETTTTAPPPTTPPSPVIAVATVDDLVAAVPQQADLPLGLALSGDPPDTAPLPSTGLGAGYCGGDSAVQRAWNAAATAIVYSADYLTSPEPGYLTIDFYAFATPEDASLFMSLTTSQETSCLGGFEYQLPEGDGPNAYSGFTGDYGQDAVWDMSETLYYAPTGVAGAEEAFQTARIYQATTRYRGTAYSSTETDVTQYERHGRIVMVFDLYGECCLTGYNDIDPSLDYEPITPELLFWADSLRPGIVERLQARGVL